MDSLRFLYETRVGRLLLSPLVSEPVSRLAGAFLDSGLSRPLIRPFVRRNHISCEDYLLDEVRSFNDFFCRRIRPELRPVNPNAENLIAPCDGLLSVFPITDGLVLPVKQSRFRISDLLRDEVLARRFDGGHCFVFRLCVEHYHRYIYPVTGEQTRTVRIPGVYHTVRPVALGTRPVFCENAREYTLLCSEQGEVLQMEVGALLVGRIQNHRREAGPVERGMEKGFFQYGGSTVILLTGPGGYLPLKAYGEPGERPVRMGQPVGMKQSKGST